MNDQPNYFELFEMPISLKVNKQALTKKYFSLQKKYHPDFHPTASEAEREKILEMSSLVNKAHKVLGDPQALLAYVLGLQGLLAPEEKYALPPAFLMEMMEYNEQLSDAKMDGDNDAVRRIQTEIKAYEIKLEQAIEPILEALEGDYSSKEKLLQMKEYYFKKKYLERILEGME